jgi:hypothetical protein
MILLCAAGFALASCRRGPQQATDAAGHALHGVVTDVIGGDAGVQGPYAFTDVRGITLDSDGRVFAADAADNGVRVFSADGRYEFAVGRYGRGPGDLAAPCCIAISPSGQLWVEDFDNQRFSIFNVVDTPARFVRSIRLPTHASGRLDRVAWQPSGEVVHVSSTFDASSNRFVLMWAALDSSGAPFHSDTLPQPPAESIGVAIVRSPTRAGSSAGTTGIAQPFGPTSLWAFGPNGMQARAVSSKYSVELLDASHRRVRLIERSAVGPLVSGPERKKAEHTLDAIAKRLGLVRSDLPFGVPSHKAPLSNLGFDLGGRLWVERAVADSAAHEADIYTPQGEWTAAVTWPANVRLDLWACRDRVAIGVAQDSLGVQRLVRLRFD